MKKEDPDEERVAKMMYEKKVKAYVEADMIWEESNKNIYNLLLLHCTQTMESKLQSMSDWAEISKKQDNLSLMMTTRDIIHLECVQVLIRR